MSIRDNLCVTLQYCEKEYNMYVASDDASFETTYIFNFLVNNNIEYKNEYGHNIFYPIDDKCVSDNRKKIIHCKKNVKAIKHALKIYDKEIELIVNPLIEKVKKLPNDLKIYLMSFIEF